MLDIPVHNTFLGKLDGKLVVACKHFYDKTEIFSSFADVRNILSSDSGTDGTSIDLKDVFESLLILNKAIGSQVEERFWDMFVVDAFINNPDRNNGNWGFVYNSATGEFERLAPVFDNGGSFNPKWDDEKIEGVHE